MFVFGSCFCLLSSDFLSNDGDFLCGGILNSWTLVIVCLLAYSFWLDLVLFRLKWLRQTLKLVVTSFVIPKTDTFVWWICSNWVVPTKSFGLYIFQPLRPWCLVFSLSRSQNWKISNLFLLFYISWDIKIWLIIP